MLEANDSASESPFSPVDRCARLTRGSVLAGQGSGFPEGSRRLCDFSEACGREGSHKDSSIGKQPVLEAGLRFIAATEGANCAQRTGPAPPW